ncbi:MAG TPA: ATP-binding protein [Burkholderiaceae bacterium]|nr:ATP-binding protein [Burkholderiaceae bacterium]
MQTLASLSLAPGPNAVPQALAWLESIAEAERWPARLAFQLSLCLDEALSNVVMYGFGPQDDGLGQPQISLELLRGKQSIVIDIVDNGVPFDPTQRASAELAATLDDARIGGHGIRLMRHYLQSIEYRRDEGKNHLRLTAANAADGA